MCVYYLFIAHFLTGHYLAKLFIPLQTINPFPRNDIAQCIIGFSRSILSETIDWIHFIPLSIIWWWREKQIVINQEFPTIQQRQWRSRRGECSVSWERSHWLTLTTCLGPSDPASPATEALLHLVTRPSTVYLEND